MKLICFRSSIKESVFLHNNPVDLRDNSKILSSVELKLVGVISIGVFRFFINVLND